jgi:hypothetical protein
MGQRQRARSARRLEKLEKSVAPIVDPDAAWGELAVVRDDFLRDQAKEHGDAYAADLRKQLDASGPVAFHLEMIRGYLKLHGIEERPNESFASTVARALDIGTSELNVRMREGTLGRDLWNKFGDVNNATDNGSYQAEELGTMGGDVNGPSRHWMSNVQLAGLVPFLWTRQNLRLSDA